MKALDKIQKIVDSNSYLAGFSYNPKRKELNVFYIGDSITYEIYSELFEAKEMFMALVFTQFEPRTQNDKNSTKSNKTALKAVKACKVYEK